MLLIPAIDIKENCCVRLKKGIMSNSIIFSKNPILVVNKWINWGAKRLHLIDLDAAFKGKPKNFFIIKSIINFVNGRIPIQVGGGIRSLDIINYYFDIGVSYVILGTKGITDINFLNNVSNKYLNKIILSLDIKNNKLAINGWNEIFNMGLVKFLKQIKNIPLESIICTDIKRDGMLKGINYKIILKISKILNKPFIASGGLGSLNDIVNLFNLQKYGLLGLICGKSIYSGKLNFYNIQKKINELNNIYISNN